MFQLDLSDNDDLLHTQILANRERISQLSTLFKSKKKSDVIDNYEIFEQFNEIAMDPDRKFTSYAPENRIHDSKRALSGIIERLHLGKFTSYCDVGCGMGYYPRAAVELGCNNSVGVDINGERFHKNYLIGCEDRLHFLCSDISSEAQTIGKFKLVTSFAAFEHFFDPYEMLESMANLVEKGGYLYITFQPIYRCTDGNHMYRWIQIPWYHIFFTDNVCQKYYYKKDLLSHSKVNYLNMWSALDFLKLFLNFARLRLLNLQIRWNLKHLWYAKRFPQMLPPYDLEELMVGGFEVIYKNE